MFFKRNDDSGLAKQVSELRIAVENCRDELEALRAQHLGLHGRVYALWGKEDKQASEPNQQDLAVPQTLPRNQLRATLTRSGRFVPGKPPVHQE